MRRALSLVLLCVGLAAAQTVAKFPSATAGWQDLLQAKDNSRSTLSALVDSSTLSVAVADGSKFTSWQAVLVESEKMLVCSVGGNTLTICAGGRGWGGTVAATHTSGLAVIGLNFQEHHNQLAAEVAAIEEALGPNLSNVATTWSSITGKPTTFLYSDQSYSDPSWLTISAGKVGLGAVENTALSTWAGSTNITTLGTISAGTVPWARLSSVPSTFAPSAHTHPVADLSTVGDYSSKITSGTYSINISGSAGSATTAGTVTNGVVTTGSYTDPSWLTLTKGKVGLGNVENTALSTWPGSANITTLGTISAGTVPWARLSSVPSTFAPSAHAAAHAQGGGDALSGTLAVSVTGNAGTVGSLGACTTANTGANCVVRTNANGYIDAGYINPTGNDVGTTAVARVFASNDSYLRYYTLANFTKQVVNAYTHDASFAWDDPYIALPLSTVMYGVFSPRAAQATITEVWCSADTADAVIQLRRSDGGDMLTSNLTCGQGVNGLSTASINGYGVIPANYHVGLWAVSGTAKQIRVGIKYTTAY